MAIGKICCRKGMGSNHLILLFNISVWNTNFSSCWLNSKDPNPGSGGLLKVVTSEKIGRSGVTSTLDSWYEGVVMGVLLPFNEAAILYRDFNSAPSQEQNIIVFAGNNSRCCECHVSCNMQSAPTSMCLCVFSTDKSALPTQKIFRSFAVWNSRCYELVAPTSPSWTQVSTYYYDCNA